VLFLFGVKDAAEISILGFFLLNISIYIRTIHRKAFLRSCGDITSVTLVFLALYTAVPIAVYLADLHTVTPMAWYGNNDALFLQVLLYHLIFSISLQVPSLVITTKNPYCVLLPDLDVRRLKFACTLLFLSVLFLVVCLGFLSGPVDSYYDHYTRYDHHTGLARSLVSVLIRAYVGLQPFVILFAVVLFRNRPSALFLLIASLCVVDLSFSQGSRIQSFMIVVQAICLYTLVANVISFRLLISVALVLVLSLTVVEVLRISTGGVSELTVESIGFAAEFLALFIPELHLYGLAAGNYLSSPGLIMHFKDLIELVPFISLPESDPMVWYWHEFHPDAQVAPYTLGPISDSAWSGGVFGLIIRGVILGFVLMSISKLLSYNVAWWIKLSAYSYSVSTSVLTLKYGVFTIYSHLLFNWVLGLVVVAAFLMLHGALFRSFLGGR
jgi:hypothetical protein